MFLFVLDSINTCFSLNGVNLLILSFLFKLPLHLVIKGEIAKPSIYDLMSVSVLFAALLFLSLSDIVFYWFSYWMDLNFPKFKSDIDLFTFIWSLYVDSYLLSLE